MLMFDPDDHHSLRFLVALRRLGVDWVYHISEQVGYKRKGRHVDNLARLRQLGDILVLNYVSRLQPSAGGHTRTYYTYVLRLLG